MSLRRFSSPRHWPTWALLGLLNLIGCLPFGWQKALGVALGRLLFRVKRRQRRIARRNLEVCFPTLTDTEREALLRRHFRSVGLSIVEMAIGWYSSSAKLERLVRVDGWHNLEAALARGKGVLLVGAHFTPVEVGAAVLERLDHPVACMYRSQRNAMMDVLIRRGRRRFADVQLGRDNVRELVRRLRQKYVVLYLPDQTYLGNQSALLPFFGEPALTNIATSKLARMGKAAVLPYFFRRLDDDSGYVVDIGPALDAFPSEDAAADTARIVALLEAYIRRQPEQYLWLYKKFKHRPADLPDLYAR